MVQFKLIQLTPEELQNTITEVLKTQFDNFKKDFSTEKANDELLTRTEACEFLKIDSSTLWAWQNKGKVKGYAIVNRRYYKRSELLDCLIPVIK
jgi:hypothetical protein